MKKTLLILLLSGLVLLAFFGGMRSFIKHIYNRTDCEQMNIDNIELRTGIDIPAVVDVDCHSKEGIKTSSFVLDTNSVNITEYIYKNDFSLSNQLYVANGDNKNTKWNATLNPLTHTLTVIIVYKNIDF